jgi:hypothetical protein
MRKNIYPLLSKNLRILVLFTIALMFNKTLKAQESVNTAGGDINSNGYQIAYSIGQVVYTTESSSLNTITQGVQQPYIQPFSYTIGASKSVICNGEGTVISVSIPGQ